MLIPKDLNVRVNKSWYIPGREVHLFCNKHPRYKVVRVPVNKCPACEFIHSIVNGKKVKELC